MPEIEFSGLAKSPYILIERMLASEKEHSMRFTSWQRWMKRKLKYFVHFGSRDAQICMCTPGVSIHYVRHKGELKLNIIGLSAFVFHVAVQYKVHIQTDTHTHTHTHTQIHYKSNWLEMPTSVKLSGCYN